LEYTVIHSVVISIFIGVHQNDEDRVKIKGEIAGNGLFQTDPNKSLGLFEVLHNLGQIGKI